MSDDVTYADIMFDNNGHVGLRFDNGQIFSMPAPLAAHLGRNLVDCAQEVRQVV
ncbi:hypothetical protein [Mycobacterium sp. E2479]|uniref:hypothetical protein n=1 Tax=Mycobacterium sp. E2479 TaxID=1834134 RepID=UPI000A5EA3E6|nr:hypothetical protein [Mycobacterium sp. E2479]